MNAKTALRSAPRREIGRFTPLQQEIEQILREFGYEICGDDDATGWYWLLDGFDSRQVRHAEESIELATLVALRDLAARTGELQAAARVVVDRWDRGDLAEAVRELDTCLAAMNSGEPEPVPVDSDVDLAVTHKAWLVHGDAKDGPWFDEAHLQLRGALTRAREIGQEWLEKGLQVDLDELEASLDGGGSYSPRDGFAVVLTPIDVRGDAVAAAT